MRRHTPYLPLLLLLAGCGQQVEVPMFSYQSCRQNMTRELIGKGVQPVAANMQAMAYCHEQQAKAGKQQ